MQRRPDSQTSSTAVNEDHPLIPHSSSSKRPQSPDGSGTTDERPRKRPRQVMLVPYVLIEDPVDPTWVFHDLGVSQKTTGTEKSSIDEDEQLVSDLLNGDCPELTDSEDDKGNNDDDTDNDDDDDGSEVDQLASDNDDDNGPSEDLLTETYKSGRDPNGDEPPIEILLPLAEDRVTMVC